jgi:hypothetical protein
VEFNPTITVYRSYFYNARELCFHCNFPGCDAKWFCSFTDEELSMSYATLEDILGQTYVQAFEGLKEHCGHFETYDPSAAKKTVKVLMDPGAVEKPYVYETTPMIESYKSAPKLWNSDSAFAEEASKKLPGILTHASYPCNCFIDLLRPGRADGPIRTIIAHLNDKHRWTFTQIADWLDTVDDPYNGVDLSFRRDNESD